MIVFFCIACGKRIGLAEAPPGGHAQCPYCQVVTPVKPGVGPPPHLGPNRFNPITWMGNCIRVSHGADPPATGCCICGEAEALTIRRKKFAWAPSTVWIGLILGIPGVLLMYFLMRKTQVVRLPVCPACNREWTHSRVALWVLLAVGIFAFPGLGALLGDALSPDAGGAVGGILGFLAWMGAIALLWHLWIRKVQPVARTVDEIGVVLQLPRPQDVRPAWEAAGN